MSVEENFSEKRAGLKTPTRSINGIKHTWNSMLLKFYETNLGITLVVLSIESNSFYELGAEKILNKVHINILLKYFWENIYRIFEFENIKFVHYSKRLDFSHFP